MTPLRPLLRLLLLSLAVALSLSASALTVAAPVPAVPAAPAAPLADYYNLLGLSPSSNPIAADVQRAFMQRAVAVHPDLYTDEMSVARFMLLVEAKSTLEKPSPARDLYNELHQYQHVQKLRADLFKTFVPPPIDWNVALAEFRRDYVEFTRSQIMAGRTLDSADSASSSLLQSFLRLPPVASTVAYLRAVWLELLGVAVWWFGTPVMRRRLALKDASGIPPSWSLLEIVGILLMWLDKYWALWFVAREIIAMIGQPQ